MGIEAAPAVSDKPLHLLMLEDVPSDAELCAWELRRAGLNVEVERVEERAAFEAALEARRPDLIISDFSMPGAFDGFTALDIAHAKVPAVPFIFVSGTIGEERAVEAMKRGATDYVLKDRLNRLAPVIKRALRETRERNALSKTERELSETRDRLDTILSALYDVVWSVTGNPLKTIYVNKAVEAVYGRPMTEFFENPDIWIDAIHRGDRETVAALWHRALEGEPFDAEYRIVTPSGEEKWVHSRGRPVKNPEGHIACVDGLLRDVTQRRSQEDRIKRLSRVQRMLSGIDAVIVRGGDKNQLYSSACRIAVHLGGFRLAWVAEIDSVTEDVRGCASFTHEDGFLEDASRFIAEESADAEGLVRLAMRTGKPAMTNDVENDARIAVRENKIGRGYRSATILPLRTGNAVSAVLGLYSSETDFFDDEEMKLLAEISENISFGLDYADKASRLDHLAYYDVLTGLPNRNLFNDRLAQMVARASAEDQQVSVIVVDLERFSKINETIGAASGDELLRRIAERLERVAERGTSSRITADRFALALPGVGTHGDRVHAVLERLQRTFDAPFEVDGAQLRIQAKVGIAVFPADAENAEALLANAEAAMRAAKAAGERFVFYAKEMNARVAEILQLENQLRVAVHESQFVLYYQPRVLLETGEVCGMEALIRWRSPTLGLVPPADFIPLLEESGLILEVGRWALERAAIDVESWRARGLDVPSVGVNVSAAQLRQKDFVEKVVAAIPAGSAAAGRIEIELTESMIMADIEENVQKLQRVREAGIKIAIDDFGTGYSSLSYLAQLPADALKVDKSFVTAMGSCPIHMGIVNTVISLARSLKLRVVAEGVEAEEQANLLRLLRCDEAQGFLYSPPVPAEEVEAVLDALGTRARARAGARHSLQGSPARQHQPLARINHGPSIR